MSATMALSIQSLSTNSTETKGTASKRNIDTMEENTKEGAVGGEMCGKSRSFRQRRLSVPLSTVVQNEEPPAKKARSDVGAGTADQISPRSLKTQLQDSKQMTLEIQPFCPVSHANMNLTPLPNGDAIIMTDIRNNNEESPSCDKKKKHDVTFPKSMASTYSCHGVEPIYPTDSFDEDDDEGDVPTTTAKINQDRGGIAFPYGNCDKTALFVVADGHGEGGELVSEYVLGEVQARLQKHPLFEKDTAEAFRKTFTAIDKSLAPNKKIDPMYSGTTACAVLMRENRLMIANVGDSRAVIGRRASSTETKNVSHDDDDDANNESSNTNDDRRCYAAHDLSVDQNPDSPGEQDRIERCGGYVSPPPEEGLSARVWLDSNCTQIGLAMSRSIGDYSVKPVGVIAEPVVTTHDVCPNTDDFMIIATDGVWEFLDSSEAVHLVSRCFRSGGGADQSCKALIEAAAAKWHEYEGDYRDDITAIVVKLDGLFDV